mmetsp:Transcript_31451/g.50444  ORF Transcript_31451/g.50444 Transcript_31451/m.50444 type:complete len:186 (-) Transcript_31451:123-680(-)
MTFTTSSTLATLCFFAAASITSSVVNQVSPSKEGTMMRKEELQIHPGGHVVDTEEHASLFQAKDDAYSQKELVPCDGCQSIYIRSLPQDWYGCYEKLPWNQTFKKQSSYFYVYCEAVNGNAEANGQGRWKLQTGGTGGAADFYYSNEGCCHLPVGEWMHADGSGQAFSDVRMTCHATQDCDGQTH